MAFFGGAALMSMELIFPKMSMIWFGNVLSVWSANLVAALATIAIGYSIGGRLVKKGRNLKSITILLYVVAGVFFLVLPYFYKMLFEGISGMGVNVGSLISAFIFMLPTIGALAVISPILVSEHEISVGTSKNSSSSVFGFSTIAGVLIILFGGLYVIPFLGLSVMMQISGAFVLLNAVLALTLFSKKS